MKKLLTGLTVLLGLGGAAAGTDWFVGIDYPVYHGTSEKVETDGTNSGSVTDDYAYRPVIFKIGAGSPEGVNMNLYYSSAKIEYDGGDSKYPLNEIGYDIRFGFPVRAVRGLAPYLEAGLSGGWMKVDDNFFDQSEIYNVGFKAGFGVSYLLAKHFQFLLGLDYKYRKWQDVVYLDTYGGETVSRTDSGMKGYLGFNVWF